MKTTRTAFLIPLSLFLWWFPVVVGTPLPEGVRSTQTTFTRPLWKHRSQASPRLDQDVPIDQPFASYWFPADLLMWSPSTDPDAEFNRGTIPLADRFQNPALNVNPHARPDEGRVVALVAFHPTSKNPSQGSATINYYALNYWQYIDVLVFWGGSAGEGLILAPNPTVVDAAHRNGVPVLGTIFFPPNVYGGQIQWVQDLVQSDGSTFPVADKLIEVAEYYGFDGWFINQETAGGDADLALQMREFMKYLKANSSLRIMWYDAMTEDGRIAWQNALNRLNDGFFHDGGIVADEMFLNFGWSSARLASSRSLAESLGRSPYDLYAGVDVEANGYNRFVSWGRLFPEGQPHLLSLGFYRPEWTYNSSSSLADFYQRDSRFWVGPHRDPSNTNTEDQWKGISHYLPAKSPINHLPFVTNFNVGHGYMYATDGRVVMNREWNNLSLQDVLPTWRWVIEGDDGTLLPDLDWSDAYTGGSSLKVSGTVNGSATLKLFQTRLHIVSDTHLQVVYEPNHSENQVGMKVRLVFEDEPERYHDLRLTPPSGNGWESTTVSLGGFMGRTLALIALGFDASSPGGDVAVNIGRIAVYNGTVDVPTPPSGLTVIRKTDIEPDRVALRLRWEHSPDPISYYNVYRRNPDMSLTYLGGTPNNAYFVAEIGRIGHESATTIEVEAVGLEFGQSNHVTTTISWDSGPARGSAGS